MIYLKLSPVVLALLLMSAHFYRANSSGLMAFCLALTLLVHARQAWAARAMQLALLLGSLEWLRTTMVLVVERRAIGQPFIRLAVILAAVALLTALCALVFRVASVRTRFGMPHLPRPQAGRKPSTDK